MASPQDLESIQASDDSVHSPRDSVSLQEFLSAIIRAFERLPITPKRDRPAPKTWRDVHSPQYLPRPMDDLVKVPNLEHFELTDVQSITEVSPDRLREQPISLAMALPPKMAELIMNLDDQSAENMLAAVFKYVHRVDTVERPTFTTVVESDNEDGEVQEPTQVLEYRETNKYLPLLQHLYAYTQLNYRKMCFGYGDDELAYEFGMGMEEDRDNRALYSDDVAEPSAPAVGQANQESDRLSRQRNPDHTMAATQGANVSQTQSDIPQTRASSTITSRQSDVNHRGSSGGIPPQINPNTVAVFTGIDSPNNRSSTGAQTSDTRAPPQSDQTNIGDVLVPVIQNMTNHQSRFTSQMERLVNATADKLDSDGTRKIGQIVKETILNASTIDGIAPAEELTPFAKDVLSATGDTPLTHIKILFAKKKVRAVPTPKFISAAKKGNLT